MKRYFVLLLCLALLWGAAFPIAVSANDPVTVRVGVYQNPPLLFTAEDGHASGIFIDVLEYIADKEGWTIEYVPGDWTELLEQLECGEIDMIGAIAYTEARSTLFDFSTESVITNWEQIYTQLGADIASVLDLEDKTIAVLKADIHAVAVKNLLQSFDVSAHLIEVEDYPSVFGALQRGEADAGVVNRLVAIRYAGDYDVRETSIIFNPVENRYAFTKGVHQDLLAALDANLQALKADDSSIYYQSLGKWFGVKHVEKPVIPWWIVWMLIGIGGLAFLLAGGSFILRSQVRSRAKELKQAEAKLQHLNLVLRAIRSVNQLIFREKDREKLLKGACDNLIKNRGYYNAWLALLDESGGLVTTAEAGWGEDFLPVLERLKRGELTDCARRALKQSELVVITDPLATCEECPLSDKCAGQAALTIRIEHYKKVYGLLVTSVPAEFAGDEEEQSLLREVAGDIAFALHAMELEEARQRAERAVEEAREYAEGIVETVREPLVVCSGVC